ncbi:histidine kinase (plasmid) [Arthrobacter sp. D3-18]
MKSTTAGIERKGSIKQWQSNSGIGDLWQLFFDVVALAVVVMEIYRISQAGVDFGSFALLTGGLAATVLRRHLPGSALATTALLTVLLPLQTGQHLPAWILLVVCLASFAMLRPRTHAVAATTAVGFILVTEAFLVMHASFLDPLTWALIAWAAAAGGVGSAVRSQRQYVEALEEQASNLLQAREAVVARRIAEERMSIARELHDVMAHHIAAISVHAGAAEANTRNDPETAMESMVRIRSASSEALRELQAILHILRSGEIDDAVDVPVAGASQIPRLIEAFRALGLTVDYHERGLIPTNLPPALDLALYRITQEGLTNVHKHGGGQARLTLRTTTKDINLEMRNDATTAPEEDHTDRTIDQQGFGLIGMQERAVSAGGRFNAKDDGKHFIIEASFPLEAG